MNHLTVRENAVCWRYQIFASSKCIAFIALPLQNALHCWNQSTADQTCGNPTYRHQMTRSETNNFVHPIESDSGEEEIM
jgi:hypothetical protein